MKKKIFGTAYIFLILFVMYLPIIVITIYSFEDKNITKLSAINDLSFALYQRLFDFTDGDSVNIWNAVKNTIVIAVAAAAVSTIIGTLGAIGIFYAGRKYRKIINSIANVSIVNAEIVTALSLRLFYSLLHIDLSFLTLLIGHVVLTLPFVVLNVTPKLQQMDKNEYEAALDLGANNTQALAKVVIPEVMPGIISGFLLSITLSLDDYIITAYTTYSVGETTFDTLSTYVYKVMVKSHIPLQLRALTTIIVVLIAVGVFVYGLVMKKKAAQNKMNAR